MVNSLIIILCAVMILVICIIIYKKPEVIKKDSSKPISISNLSLKKSFIGDWKSFLIWILLMYLVWSYAHDTQACRDFMENLDEMCSIHINSLSYSQYGDIELGELNLVGDTDGESISWSGDKRERPDSISADS